MARLVARVLIAALLVGLLPSPAQASLLPSHTPKLPDRSLDEGRSVFALVVLAEGMPCAVLFVLADPHLPSKYHRARWMDPRVGRFASIDPFPGFRTDPITLHRYLYAGTDPTDKVDPTGHFFDSGSALTGLAGGTALRTTSTINTVAVITTVVVGLAVAGVLTAVAFGGAGVDERIREQQEEAAGERIHLYHGTSSNRAAKIVGSQFYDGIGFDVSDDAFFAEDIAGAAYFASQSIGNYTPGQTPPGSLTVIDFSILVRLLPRLPDLLGPGEPFGTRRGLRFPDVPGSNGLERVLNRPYVPAFNGWLRVGVITYTRLRL